MCRSVSERICKVRLFEGEASMCSSSMKEAVPSRSSLNSNCSDLVSLLYSGKSRENSVLEGFRSWGLTLMRVIFEFEFCFLAESKLMIFGLFIFVFLMNN